MCADEITATAATATTTAREMDSNPNVQGTCKSSESVQVEFHETAFNGLYQRNNKRGGLKNLRCFPNCGFQHKERGFCGRSVKVRVSHPPEKEIICFAQFLLKDQQDDSTVGINPTIGDTVSLSQLSSLERTPTVLIKPFIRGESNSPDPSIREFNRKLKGWHYGWAANKHSCNAEHCFKVYAMEKVDDDKLICRASCVSRSFLLFCRRRRRFRVEPSAPIAKPNQHRRNQRISASKCPATVDQDCSTPNTIAAPLASFPMEPTKKRKRAVAQRPRKRVRNESNGGLIPAKDECMVGSETISEPDLFALSSSDSEEESWAPFEKADSLPSETASVYSSDDFLPDLDFLEGELDGFNGLEDLDLHGLDTLIDLPHALVAPL